jgi:hypothetical protein
MNDANGTDKLQVVLCVLAILCIATLFAIDLYMGRG